MKHRTAAAPVYAAVLILAAVLTVTGCGFRKQQKEQSGWEKIPAAEMHAGNTAQAEAPETAEDEGSPADRYAAVTSLGEEAVEAYAEKLKESIFRADIKELLQYVSFPLTIDGVKYSSVFGLAGLDYSSGIRQSFVDAITAEDCREMTCTEEGILMGQDGQIRIREVDGELKVVELRGLLQQ